MFDVLYYILLVDENNKQYLVRFIIFICIRYGAPHIKKAPQVCLAPQGPKRLLGLSALYALNNYGPHLRPL